MKPTTALTSTWITILSSLWLTACVPETEQLPSKSYQEAWGKSRACTLRLVAYRTSKSSKYVLEEAGTGHLFIMRGLGGRRIPKLQLGESIISKCDYGSDAKRITEFEYHKKSIVVHTSGTVFRHLPGYEHLEKSL